MTQVLGTAKPLSHHFLSHIPTEFYSQNSFVIVSSEKRNMDDGWRARRKWCWDKGCSIFDGNILKSFTKQYAGGSPLFGFTSVQTVISSFAFSVSSRLESGGQERKSCNFSNLSHFLYLIISLRLRAFVRQTPGRHKQHILFMPSCCLLWSNADKKSLALQRT